MLNHQQNLSISDTTTKLPNAPYSELWRVDSWRKKTILQAPEYRNLALLAEVEHKLSLYPPLVLPAEIERLKQRLSQVAQGKAVLLQGGDCAESFEDFSLDAVRDNLRILLQMSILLSFHHRLPVVKIGRIAGQFAKPRSNDFETRDGSTLPVYRGDIINGFNFTADARDPDPTRMERAYFHSSARLAMVRALSQTDFFGLNQLRGWNEEFVKRSRKNQHYQMIAQRLEQALSFGAAIGFIENSLTRGVINEFYSSHEALLLQYEQSLTRYEPESSSEDPRVKGWYACSAHMLWLGDRTRQLDGAHIEYLRGIKNPIGLKCGPSLTADELIKIIDTLDPHNEPGRLTLISRMGAENIEKLLLPLVKRTKSQGRNVIWCCDPMHGNTIKTQAGYKTREFSRILSEVRSFSEILASENSHAGGLHFEFTGRDVIECLGGEDEITENDLCMRSYRTLCDPRLNAIQSLELAFQLCR